jgi:hypothetical protein
MKITLRGGGAGRTRFVPAQRVDETERERERERERVRERAEVGTAANKIETKR